MATITVRQLDANGDPIWGQGAANYISDLDAVAQIVLTSLKLFQGEWWADLSAGLPLWQSILGVGGAGRNQNAVNALIQAVILGCPYVTGISNVSSAFTSATRGYTFFAVVQTQFGKFSVTNTPQPSSGSTN